jgi:hypothetical protein
VFHACVDIKAESKEPAIHKTNADTIAPTRPVVPKRHRDLKRVQILSKHEVKPVVTGIARCKESGVLVRRPLAVDRRVNASKFRDLLMEKVKGTEHYRARLSPQNNPAIEIYHLWD